MSQFIYYFSGCNVRGVKRTINKENFCYQVAQYITDLIFEIHKKKNKKNEFPERSEWNFGIIFRAFQSSSLVFKIGIATGKFLK